jgi:osmoprotectant transport system ATP-binding protein
VTAAGASAPAAGASIVLDRVSKRYEGAGDAPAAVEDLSLQIPAGSVCVLVGPSGCGKTTTLKMINRLIIPTGGRILVDGRDVADRDVTELRRGIGYVIQQAGLFPHQTVADNVATVPRLLGWDANRRRDRTEELLELVGLDPGAYRDRFPAQLSGGERQRVGVARALAADPPVLLMDEPFGAVDPIVRTRLQDELLAIQARLARTIVFVTHDIDEAIRLGDLIAVMETGGRLAQFGPPEALLASPASAFVARFVGADRGLKRLSLHCLDELALLPLPPAGTGERPDGMSSDLTAPLPMLDRNSTLRDALSALLDAAADRAVVADEDGTPLGVVTPSLIADALGAGTAR